MDLKTKIDNYIINDCKLYFDKCFDITFDDLYKELSNSNFEIFEMEIKTIILKDIDNSRIVTIDIANTKLDMDALRRKYNDDEEFLYILDC